MVWAALALALALVAGSAVYATLKGLAAYRALKTLGGAVGGGVDRIAASTAGIEHHLADAATAGTRLDRSLARLRVSRARLNVLRSAIADVKAVVGRVTAVYPRK